MGKVKSMGSKTREQKRPAELEDALNSHITARELFEHLSPSCQKQYIDWVAGAKKEENRQKRAKETIAMLIKKQQG